MAGGGRESIPSTAAKKGEELMAEEKSTRRIQLVRSIILNGEHADEGEVHEVHRALAHHLIGEGSAVPDGDDESDPGKATAVNRMQEARNRDPRTDRASGAKPPTVKKE
jgi:hypothetical protein